VIGARPLTVAALDCPLELLKYPGAFSLLAISAGLRTPPYLACLIVRTSADGKGELGRSEALLEFSDMELDEKFSICLEYLLFAGGVGADRFAFDGRGDPEEEGV
jgi:hypothetical protein